MASAGRTTTSADVLSVTKQFGECLRSCLSDSAVSDKNAAFSQVESAFGNATGYDTDAKRILLDQSFRDCLTNGYLSSSSKDPHPELGRCRFLLEVGIASARAEMCSSTLPIVLMLDLFDVLSLDDSERFFGSCVEENVSVWKEDIFFSAVKNNLLRICNDLLRRLSPSQNTVFCGRILLFLARFFPFSERSGLNIISEFNLDNHTVYAEEENSGGSSKSDAAAKDEAMEVEVVKTIKAKNLNIDYALYSKFWQLQDYFRNPVQCYDKAKWSTFSKHAREVMETFRSFKIDSVAAKKKAQDSGYFAKYLTNQNLLQLQLSDCNFRRYVLVQFLILFQYLRSTVKFKNEKQVLTDEQSRWVEASTRLVYELMAETPPDGEAFCRSVRHILKREEKWNAWKNEGCPATAPKPAAANGNPSKAQPKPVAKSASSSSLLGGGGTRKRKKKLGDQIREATAAKKFLMGNAALTKLWNFCPDNYEAAAAPERDFLPNLDEYMAEATEQLDPKNQVEKEYMKVHDGQWGWRALRLLAKKSPHFFTYGNNPIGKLPEYLETMLKKMNPGMKSPTVASTPAGNASNGEADESKKDTSAPSDGGDDGDVALICSEDHLKALATNLKADWRKLIPKLGQTNENATEYEKEADESKRALLMLSKWAKEESAGATKDEICYVLDGLKLAHVHEGVF